VDLNLTITLLAVFVAVGLLTWSLANLAAERSSPIRHRLNALVATGNTLGVIGPKGTVASPGGTLVPLSPKKMGELQRRLTGAGFHSPRAATYFSVVQVALVLVLGTAPLLLLGTSRGTLAAVIGAILGYFIPGLVLDHRISKYRLRIENGLPDALDLLIVSLEAGLALDQAILKCAEEFTIAHPELAEEFRLINVECRAGKPRLEAFKNFAARTNVDDVRSLVAMLVQTDRFGTSVAQALRTHAEVSRTKRRQRAEERAAKIGVKLVFPLVFCLFPAFYVVTLGPAIIKFIKAFGSGGFATGG
jgi:tight adherence protein C